MGRHWACWTRDTYHMECRWTQQKFTKCRHSTWLWGSIWHWMAIVSTNDCDTSHTFIYYAKLAPSNIHNVQLGHLEDQNECLHFQSPLFVSLIHQRTNLFALEQFHHATHQWYHLVIQLILRPQVSCCAKCNTLTRCLIWPPCSNGSKGFE